MAYTTINDPSAHHQTAIWTGNGVSGTAVVNDGNSNLQPDWLWGKIYDDNADVTRNHWMIDSTRGLNKSLGTNTQSAEETNSGYLNSFDSDGFTLGNDGNSNDSGDLVVGWQWKANGGTTTTNDASATGVGTIDSVIQANTTAGFSIVTHTGTGSAGNIAHGLGAVPEWIITRNRTDGSTDWAIYHAHVGNAYYLELNTTDGRETASSVWGDTTPSSTTFRVGGANTKNNATSKEYISYCFTGKKGYSKFGGYKGNGTASGPFVYLGFKPAWLMIKVFNGNTGGWDMYDNTRTPFNSEVPSMLQANANAEHAQSDQVDFLSNGFKIRNTTGNQNGSNNDHVYMAFAENPFVTSGGTPGTAR